MRPSKRLSVAVLAMAVTTPLLLEIAPAQAQSGKVVPTARLPLGPSNLPETRTVEQLAPGLALTTIVRGKVDPKEFWSIAINLPVGEVKPDPDPDADQGSLGTLAKAKSVVAQLEEHPAIVSALADRGWEPRIEAVDWASKMSDFEGG